MCPYPQYPCTDCSKSFKHFSWLQKHRKTHMNLKIECTICNKQLSSTESVKRHMSVHEKKRKKKYKCQICSCKYFHESDLVYHVKTTHEQTDKIKCTQCEKLYKTEKLMKSHFINFTSEYKNSNVYIVMENLEVP